MKTNERKIKKQEKKHTPIIGIQHHSDLMTMILFSKCCKVSISYRRIHSTFLTELVDAVLSSLQMEICLDICTHISAPSS